MQTISNPVITSGLSANELFCLKEKGLSPGKLVLGNSVVSLGVVGGVVSGLEALAGGEVSEVTRLIQEGREKSFKRLQAEAARAGGIGVTSVSSDIVVHGTNIEFLSVGSCVRSDTSANDRIRFTSASSGQELYSLLDSGYSPVQFVFGNVAYALGVPRSIFGALRSISRGEVQEYTSMLSDTRHLALARIENEAKQAGAAGVLGIDISVRYYRAIQEMIMVGTAVNHPALASVPSGAPIVTSALRGEEIWSATHSGYVPVRLVLGVAVYSLGLKGGITSTFRSLVRGEIPELTHLIYEARETAIARIQAEAQKFGAETVLGTKVYVHNLGGGLLEFLAVGTAVKRRDDLKTLHAALPAQAMGAARDSFVTDSQGQVAMLNTGGGDGSPQISSPFFRGGFGWILSLLFFVFVVLKGIFRLF